MGRIFKRDILQIQQKISCSKLTIETLQKSVKSVKSKLTIETAERCHLRRSGVFILNSEHISHFYFTPGSLLLTLNWLMFAGKSTTELLTITTSTEHFANLYNDFTVAAKHKFACPVDHI